MTISKTYNALTGHPFYPKRFTKWNYQSGHPYPQYSPMTNRQINFQYDENAPGCSHGIRPLTVVLTGLEGSPDGAKSDLRDDKDVQTCADVDECADGNECVDIDECANVVGQKRKRLTKKKHSKGRTLEPEGAPEAKLSTRGTYHIQKKRSLACKFKALANNVDIVNSETEAIAPPVIERPVIVRPRPGPAVQDPITTVYGFGF